MTTSPEIHPSAAAVRRCDGEPCPATNPWPLHHVGNLAAFRRLCTGCVLRRHRGFFCSVCLNILESPPPPSGDLRRCLRCPSAAHSSCIPAAAADYLCTTCQDPDWFPDFPAGGGPVGAAEARALLSASRIAAASMSRAAAAARGEAERKGRQAATAGRIAREVLERVCERKGDGIEGKENRENSSCGRINGVVKVKKRKKKKRMRILSCEAGLG